MKSERRAAGDLTQELTKVHTRRGLRNRPIAKQCLKFFNNPFDGNSNKPMLVIHSVYYYFVISYKSLWLDMIAAELFHYIIEHLLFFFIHFSF